MDKRAYHHLSKQRYKDKKNTQGKKERISIPTDVKRKNYNLLRYHLAPIKKNGGHHNAIRVVVIWHESPRLAASALATGQRRPDSSLLGVFYFIKSSAIFWFNALSFGLFFYRCIF